MRRWAPRGRGQTGTSAYSRCRLRSGPRLCRDVGPQLRQLRAGATEQQLDLLAPEEVTVDRIGDVRSHAAVQVLGGVHGALSALGGLPLGHPRRIGGVAAGVEAPRRVL